MKNPCFPYCPKCGIKKYKYSLMCRKCSNIELGNRNEVKLKRSIFWKTNNPMFKEEYCKKVSESRKKFKHPFWKGDFASYSAQHIWIRNNKKKLNICEHCKKETKTELANISGTYLRDINDYLWLCRSCHRKMDYPRRKTKIGVPKDGKDKDLPDYIRSFFKREGF